MKAGNTDIVSCFMACNGLINYLLLRRSSEGRRGFYACSIHSKFEKDI